METTLFSDRSLWTMFHGLVLGGGGLILLFAALFGMQAMRTDAGLDSALEKPRQLAWPLVLTDLTLLLIALGVLLTFPPLRHLLG